MDVIVALTGDAMPRWPQQQLYQAVLQAASNCDLMALQRLDPRAVQTARCATGCTALHWAAGCRHQGAAEVQAVCAYLMEELQMSPNIRCTGKAMGRTPLHYAARNGCLTTAQYLVLGASADPHARAKHGVTPFQLAVFQNQLELCRWLVESCGVEAAQERNDFGCGAVHWLAICPNSKTVNDLLPMAEWLLKQGCDFRETQKQGHSAFHKAAWKGHLQLVQWMHERLDIWDDAPDHAGNFAADLARMGQHGVLVDYLQQHCSRERAASCAILNIPLEDASDPTKVRKAFLTLAKRLHPDRQQQEQHSSLPQVDLITAERTTDGFDTLKRAYHHLTVEAGRGKQHNPAHSLKLLLEHLPSLHDHDDNDERNGNPEMATAAGIHDSDDTKYLKARLTAVLLEFGEKGVNVCNLPRKWRQVWGPDVPFPFTKGGSHNNDNMSMTEALYKHCADVLELRWDERTGAYWAHIKDAGRLQTALRSNTTVLDNGSTTGRGSSAG